MPTILYTSFQCEFKNDGRVHDTSSITNQKFGSSKLLYRRQWTRRPLQILYGGSTKTVGMYIQRGDRVCDIHTLILAIIVIDSPCLSTLSLVLSLCTFWRTLYGMCIYDHEGLPCLWYLLLAIGVARWPYKWGTRGHIVSLQAKRMAYRKDRRALTFCHKTFGQNTMATFSNPRLTDTSHRLCEEIHHFSLLHEGYARWSIWSAVQEDAYTHTFLQLAILWQRPFPTEAIHKLRGWRKR